MDKLYLDTCIISGIAKSDISDLELNTLTDLLKDFRLNKVDMVTSQIAKQEIEKIPEQYRFQHSETYKTLTEIPLSSSTFSPFSGPFGGPFDRNRLPVKELKELQSLLKDKDDAKHIYQAFRNKVNYFLTVDASTILNRAKEIFEICGVSVMLPSEYNSRR